MNPPLIAYWPIKDQPLSLGNLLTFRQEIEIVASLRNKDRAVLYFSDDSHLQVPFLKDALTSRLSIETRSGYPTEIDWPPSDPEIGRWPYGSLRRISLLSRISKTFPVLHWPAPIENEAKKQICQLKNNEDFLIAVHLKQQSANSEESNANFAAWGNFFAANKDCRFLLLGKDLPPPSILELKNVFFAEQTQMSLPVQLAAAAMSDGFMGMASGICSAAIFSEIPYVIFKHPAHHPEEMKIELNADSRFPFSKPTQQLWRVLDRCENLQIALERILNHG